MSSTRDGIPGTREAEQAHAGFLARYPAYTHTTLLDQLRNTQYRRLDDHHQVYQRERFEALTWLAEPRSTESR